MLGGIKNSKSDCFIRVYLIALNVLLECLNIDTRKFYIVNSLLRYKKLYRYILWQHYQQYYTHASFSSTTSVKYMNLLRSYLFLLTPNWSG